MTTEQMMQKINDETNTQKMTTKSEALEWLEDLSSMIDGSIDALRQEIEEEDSSELSFRKEPA